MGKWNCGETLSSKKRWPLFDRWEKEGKFRQSELLRKVLETSAGIRVEGNADEKNGL